MLKNRKQLVALGLVLGLLGAFAAYRTALNWVGVPGKLYQYYPVSTGFYLELAPGDKLTRRFVAFLDNQAAQEETLQKERQALLSPKNTEPATSKSQMEGKKPEAIAKESIKAPATPDKSANTAPNPAQASQPQPKNFRRIFLSKFNSTFESYVSLGIWPDPDLAGTGLQTNGGHTLVVLPLKEDMTLPAVVKRFDLELKDFKQETFAKIPYLEESHSGTSMAILNQKLLITNTARAMQSTLSHYARHEKNVYDEPGNQRYLSELPWFRQGTFILNNAVYTRKALAKTGQIGTKIAGMGDILPLTVGAIQAQPDQRVAVRFMTPVQLQSIPDVPLRKSLQAIIQPVAAFPQATQLPQKTGLMVGLTHPETVYDFYHDFMISPENARWAQMLQMLLSSFHLDFRKDVVGLLSQRTVIASQFDHQPSLMVVTDKTDTKDKSLDKISTLLSTNAFPIKLKKGQLDDLSFKTLSLPGNHPNSQLQYGTVGTSLVFATPQDYTSIVKVTRHEEKSLAETPAYYTTMGGLPNQANALLYLNVQAQANTQHLPVGLQNPGQWLEAIGVALWLTPQPKGNAVLNGQFNLKLANPKKQPG